MLRLDHFISLLFFSIPPENNKKPFFKGGIKRNQWYEMGYYENNVLRE